MSLFSNKYPVLILLLTGNLPQENNEAKILKYYLSMSSLCYLVHLFLQSSCSPKKKKKLFLLLGRVLTKYVCSLPHLSTVTQSSGEQYHFH